MHGQSLRLLNKNDKTILRIQVENSKIKDKTGYKNLNSHLEIQPLRGYANQVSGVLNLLPPGDITTSRDDLLKRGLAALDKIPVLYFSLKKPPIFINHIRSLFSTSIPA